MRSPRSRPSSPVPIRCRSSSPTSLVLAAHGEAGHRGHGEGATGYPDAVDVGVDNGGSPMAPADSLARLRKALMDRAARREAPVTQLCREAGISRSRFYELRKRYRQYGETGLRPRPRPTERPRRQLPEPLLGARQVLGLQVGVGVGAPTGRRPGRLGAQPAPILLALGRHSCPSAGAPRQGGACRRVRHGRRGRSGGAPLHGPQRQAATRLRSPDER